MTDEQLAENIGAALFQRQRERCSQGPAATILPEWKDLPESSKVFWRKDGFAVIAAIEAAGLAVVPVEPTHTHRKGGKYFRFGIGRIQSDTPLNDMDEVVVYMADKDGTLWARKRSEFEDGRFAMIGKAGGE